MNQTSVDGWGWGGDPVAVSSPVQSSRLWVERFEVEYTYITPSPEAAMMTPW